MLTASIEKESEELINEINKFSKRTIFREHKIKMCRANGIDQPWKSPPIKEIEQ